MSAPAPAPDTAGESIVVVPEKFRCPISGELMKDPVLLETGVHYDRPFIEKWFHEGHNTCPRTNTVLRRVVVTPGYILRRLISLWCSKNGVEFPLFDYERIIDVSGHLNDLLQKLSSSTSSVPDQKSAAKELRLLTEARLGYTAAFADLPNSFERLLHPLSPDHNINLHSDLQEDLIATFCGMSVNLENSRQIGEDPFVVDVLAKLILSLQFGNIVTKSKAANAISMLSFHVPNKLVIGNAGALKPLVVLLDEARAHLDSDLMEEAALAIFSLCSNVPENTSNAVATGAVGSILRNINQAGVIVGSHLASLLATLSTDRKAVEEMCRVENTVPCLMQLTREAQTEIMKEHYLVVLYAMCRADESKLGEILVDERVNYTISKLQRSSRVMVSHYACLILQRLLALVISLNFISLNFIFYW